MASVTSPYQTSGCILSSAPRLRQVLHGLLRGLSEKQVARELNISRHTVHVHVTSLYRRYSGAAGATPPPMVPVSCQCDPPVTEPPIPLFTWWVATTEDEQRPLISNDGKMMQGQIGTVLKFTWNFTASGPQ